MSLVETGKSRRKSYNMNRIASSELSRSGERAITPTEAAISKGKNAMPSMLEAIQSDDKMHLLYSLKIRRGKANFTNFPAKANPATTGNLVLLSSRTTSDTRQFSAPRPRLSVRPDLVSQ